MTRGSSLHIGVFESLWSDTSDSTLALTRARRTRNPPPLPHRVPTSLRGGTGDLGDYFPSAAAADVDFGAVDHCPSCFQADDEVQSYIGTDARRNGSCHERRPDAFLIHL